MAALLRASAQIDATKNFIDLPLVGRKSDIGAAIRKASMGL
jgi:hypothetical protein